MSTNPSGQGFPQMIADAAPGSIIRRQSLSWMPAFLAPFFLLFAYGGFFHQRAGYEKAGHIAGSVCLALGAICIYLEWSRRRKRITLCFQGGMVGLYRLGEFHYAFREEQFVPYRLHPFNTGRMVLITGALAVGCLVLFIFDKKATPWDRVLSFALTAVLWAALISTIRSRVLSDWFFVPSGKGGKRKLLFFSR